MHGCGGAGADVVLWTFVDGQQLFSREAVRWPGDGRTTTFKARFSPSAPDGAALPTVQFNGEAYGAGGRHVRPGTPVEAFVDGTRCGAGAVRRTGSSSGYLLAVVGPESIPGCTPDATITFRWEAAGWRRRRPTPPPPRARST